MNLSTTQGLFSNPRNEGDSYCSRLQETLKLQVCFLKAKFNILVIVEFWKKVAIHTRNGFHMMKLLIILATRDRPHLLYKTLKNIAPQLRPGDRLVISDASERRPNSKITKPTKDLQFVSVLKNSSKSMTANRNHATKNIDFQEFDYWCFFDDDLEVAEDYLEEVRKFARNIEGGTAFTGFINSDLPNSPNFLGFYKKSARNGNFLKMPHSVGTWIPTGNYPKFNYETVDTFGYDELELRDYLFRNSIKIRICQNLRIKHEIHEYATLRNVDSREISAIRIRENARSLRRNQKTTLRIILFLSVANAHAHMARLKREFSDRNRWWLLHSHS
jgi:glycosyltransferase involved in cell wall biosynthesis